MGEVIALNKKRTFSLEDAKKHLPIVRRVTIRAHKKISIMKAQLLCPMSAEQKKYFETKIKAEFQKWYDQIHRLGCESKGMWLVDFDNGAGYYCWKFPESDVSHFHGYFEGFQSRREVQ